MLFLKNSLIKTLLAACLLSLLTGTVSFAKDKQVTQLAYVDLKYIHNHFSLIEIAYKKMLENKARLERMIATADQEISTLQTQNIEEAELQAKHDSVQAILDQEVLNFHKRKQEFDQIIQGLLDSSLAKIAKSKSLDAVIEKKFVLNGGTDLTQEYLASLEEEAKKIKLN